MRKLEDFTTDELTGELKRRGSLLENMPVAVDPKSCDPIWAPLIKMCQGVLDDVINGDYHEDNDDTGYIYEEAMKAVFGGPEIFNWINKNTP